MMQKHQACVTATSCQIRCGARAAAEAARRQYDPVPLQRATRTVMLLDVSESTCSRRKGIGNCRRHVPSTQSSGQAEGSVQSTPWVCSVLRIWHASSTCLRDPCGKYSTMGCLAHV